MNLYKVFGIKYLVLFGLLFTTLYLLLTTPVANATYNPTSLPNNHFGVHLISGTDNEASEAAEMVNSNGDWGYVTVLIESKNRDQNRWQNFFDDLRRRHLIPIVRLATQPVGNYWKRPYDGEETAWADFLDSLIWPTKNRYVVIYNEPNHAQEWENEADPGSYAKTLDKTIDALKKKNPDFFVLNAGLDASAPFKIPAYMDSYTFMKKMDEAIPGIFNKLDGWVSHSYPNPNFAGLPDAKGRGTVRTWEWELEVLNELKVTKVLPVFITETGWKHAEGLNYDRSLPNADKVADNYKKAFENAWSSLRIIAVTPFLLNYQDFPFDHFSFKKITGEKQTVPDLPNSQVLGIQFPNYYPQFETIKDLPKTFGQPIQENKAQLTRAAVFKENLLSSFEGSPSGSFSSSLVTAEEYNLQLTLKNTGQSIWNDNSHVKLIPLNRGKKFNISPISLSNDKKVEPGQNYTFDFKIRAPEGGSHTLRFNLVSGDKPFESEPFELNINVKSPVNLQVEARLKWKSNFSGEYLLTVFGEIKNAISRSVSYLTLNQEGKSKPIETKLLIPDREYYFTLEKPFYKSKTITQKVSSGLNKLDFGELQPNIASAILQPSELWKLLPWSN